MMAGPTTQASTPIGRVTDAQMARILVREYCLVSAASSTRAGNGCVFVISAASRGRWVVDIGPNVPTSPPVVLDADEACVLPRDDVAADRSYLSELNELRGLASDVIEFPGPAVFQLLPGRLIISWYESSGTERR